MRETDRGPQLSVPIDAELKVRLEAAAAREDRPVASFVRRIVMKALDGDPEFFRTPTRRQARRPARRGG